MGSICFAVVGWRIAGLNRDTPGCVYTGMNGCGLSRLFGVVAASCNWNIRSLALVSHVLYIRTDLP